MFLTSAQDYPIFKLKKVLIGITHDQLYTGQLYLDDEWTSKENKDLRSSKKTILWNLKGGSRGMPRWNFVSNSNIGILLYVSVGSPFFCVDFIPKPAFSLWGIES